MTTNNGSYAHNGAGRKPGEFAPTPYHENWQQMERDFLTVGWLFWTMQVMLESWGAEFSVLFLFGLSTSFDPVTTGFTVTIYLLLGVALNGRNQYQPQLLVSPPHPGRRLMQLLAWPLRQAVRDMQTYLLSSGDKDSGHQLEADDIRFTLFLIVLKWLNVWMLVTVFLPVAIMTILEQVGG